MLKVNNKDTIFLTKYLFKVNNSDISIVFIIDFEQFFSPKDRKNFKSYCSDVDFVNFEQIFKQANLPIKWHEY